MESCNFACFSSLENRGHIFPFFEVGKLQFLNRKNPVKNVFIWDFEDKDIGVIYFSCFLNSLLNACYTWHFKRIVISSMFIAVCKGVA